MTPHMKSFTVATQNDIRKAASLGFPLLMLTADLSKGPPFFPRRAARGDILGIYKSGAGIKADPPFLARAAARAGFSGALLDLGDENSHEASLICRALLSSGLTPYVPAELAECSERCALIVPGAISGGSFELMLEHFKSSFPKRPLALDLVRTRHEFTMPSKEPFGKLVRRERFANLMEKYPRSYFSPQLVCRYITFKEDGKPRFLMFDTPETAALKADMARKAGFSACFALYGEWGGDIPLILG